MDLVLNPLVAGHQLLDRIHIGALRRLHLIGPLPLQLGVAHDGGRHDEGCVGLVDIALRQLGEAPAGPVADQLMAAGAGNPLDQHDVGGMLED